MESGAVVRVRGADTTARLVLRRLLPHHTVDAVMDHVQADRGRVQKKWHFMLTRDIAMLCRQFAYGRWRWLWKPPRTQHWSEPSFLSRVRSRGPQRLGFVRGWYLLGGKMDAYIEALEQITRPSGARTSPCDEMRDGVVGVRYCWMHDQRRYFQIHEDAYGTCDECHELMSTKWSSWCSVCRELYCSGCRLCGCDAR